MVIENAKQIFYTLNVNSFILSKMPLKLLDYSLGNGVRAFSTCRCMTSFPDKKSDSMGYGGYAGFNVTHYCGDTPKHVMACRQELCSLLNIDNQHLVLPRQTHTDNVFMLDKRYFETFPEMRWRLLEEQDAVVTNLRGVCIGVSTADCVPVLMYDPVAGVVAAVHAGWRGMVKRIPVKAIEVMKSIGAEACRLRVAVGPSIGLESFEVGEEVVDAFLDAGFHPCILSRQQPRPHIDLWGACSMMLEEAGVPLRQIHVAGVDTFLHPDDFFSARRLGIKSGRIFSGIIME